MTNYTLGGEINALTRTNSLLGKLMVETREIYPLTVNS